MTLASLGVTLSVLWTVSVSFSRRMMLSMESREAGLLETIVASPTVKKLRQRFLKRVLVRLMRTSSR